MSTSAEPTRQRSESRLVRLGFADEATAKERIALPSLDIGGAPDLLAALGEAADPDLALDSLIRLAEAEDPTALRAALREQPGLRERLIAVLGVSSALGDHLVRHPEDWRLLEPEPGPPAKPETLRAEFSAPASRISESSARSGSAASPSAANSAGSPAMSSDGSAMRSDAVASSAKPSRTSRDSLRWRDGSADVLTVAG